MHKPGMRVAALMDSNPKTKKIRMFGYGEYVGDEVPGSDSVGFASLLHNSGIKNPKIVLDNGQVVWGCECWWGPADGFEKKYPTPLWTIEMVDIDWARKGANIPKAKA